MREDRWARADSLIRRKFGTVPFGDQMLFAVHAGDTAAERQLLAEAPGLAAQKGRRIPLAIETGWLLSTYLEELPRAEVMTQLGTASFVAPGVRASAHQLLAGIALAGGRWRAAQSEFAALARTHPDSALIGRALAASLPFLRVPMPELEDIRGAVERWTPGSEATSPLPPAVKPITRQLRLYLLGLLSARLGAAARALRYAAELERLPAPAESAPLVRGLGLTIRADVAVSANRSAEALALLDSIGGQVPFELIRLPYFSYEHARYLRTLVLRQVSQQAEALRLAEVGFVGTPWELLYRAPNHRLRAEIHLGLGDRSAAAQEYSRFVALWQECDPALQPLVEDAKAELASLAAEPR